MRAVNWSCTIPYTMEANTHSSTTFRNSIIPFMLTASLFQCSVILLPKARGADAVEDQVAIARVGDALSYAGGDDDYVAGSDVRRREVADLDASLPRGKDVALDGAFHVMPGGRDTGFDAGSGDGERFVGGVVVALDDVTALGSGEFFSGILFPENRGHSGIVSGNCAE